MKIRVENSSSNLIFKSIGNAFYNSLIFQLIRIIFSWIGKFIPKQIFMSLLINNVLILIVAAIIFFSFPNSMRNKFIVFAKSLFESSDKIEEVELPEPIGFLMMLDLDEISTIYLSVKDEASRRMPAEVKDKLKVMGSELIEELALRGSYAAVIEDGVVVAEELNNNAAVKLKFNNVTLISAGYNAGNNSEIILRSKNYSLNRRGLNVVAFRNDQTLEQFVFDFYDSANQLSKRYMRIPYAPDLDNLQIIVKDKQYQKLQKKREEALEIGILLTSDEDYIPAAIKFKGKKYDARIRLKGDWTDHLVSDRKWSFRINLNGDNTVFGMSKFNIHHPRTRRYIGEWIFHKALKREGLIGLRYAFINVEINIKSKEKNLLIDLGTYALEESFDKYLIEDNRRREGVIVKVNENLIWEGTAQARKLGLEGHLGQYQLTNFNNVNILPFSEKRTLKDSALNIQFENARNLYYNYIHNKRSISEVFDLEKLAKYNAISCLFGGEHGIIYHNQRLYYNPITSKLEPIGFDANAGLPLKGIHFYAKSQKDIKYLEAFARELERVSQTEYLDSLLWSLDGIYKNDSILKIEFPGASFNKNILYQNQKIIENELHPSKAFHAFLLNISGNRLTVQLRSIAPFPIEIININYKGLRVISEPPEAYILKPGSEQVIDFMLPQYYINLFVNKKSRKVSFSKVDDVEDLQITYRTYGTSKTKIDKILPWKEKRDNIIPNNLISGLVENIKEFNFLHINEEDKRITFLSGDRILDKDLIIPKGYEVIATQGLNLNLLNNAKIISYSPLYFKGTVENPIKIFSSNRTGQGILVIGTNKVSEISHVYFQNLSNPKLASWSVSGAVNFYESPVRFEYVLFERNRCEDALNVIRTNFKMNNSIFRSIKADAFDGDFVKGTMKHIQFENIGNDAIDISGSDVELYDIRISNAGDKGISAGEKSTLKANNITILNSEIAIASKDLSSIFIDTILIDNCKLGFTAFQKKHEYGPATITAFNALNDNSSTLYLIETNSSLIFNQKKMKTEENVLGRMYGKQYGKSSE